MSARVRVIAVASLLVVFFGVGAVWLVSRATSTGSKPVAATADEVQQPAESSDPAAAGEPGATAGRETTSPDSGGSGGANPPKPRRIVTVAGADLQGESAGDYCIVLLLNDIDVTVAVDGISLSATPAPVTVVRDDETGSAGQSAPLCAAGSIPAEDECLVGVGWTDRHRARTTSPSASTSGSAAPPRSRCRATRSGTRCRHPTSPSTRSGRTPARS